MTDFESIETNTSPIDIQFLDQTQAYEPQAPQWTLRDRLLHTRTGRAFTAFTTALGIGGSADAAASPVVAHNTLLRPAQARHMIFNYFDTSYNDIIPSMHVEYQTVKAHHLVMEGVCNPKKPYDPAAKDVVDSRTTLTTTSCTKYNGAYIVRKTPHSTFPYSEQRHVTYTQLLDNLGLRAARSANIADDKHGNAFYTHTSPHKIILDYTKDPSLSTTRQLKTLKLIVKNGHEVSKKTWY